MWVPCESSWVDALGVGRPLRFVLGLVQFFLHLETFLSPTPHLLSVRSFWSIEIGNTHSQFSRHAFVSVTHLIPSLSLGGLPAACVYLTVLWCHLISSHTVVLWDKHGLVCLITGFHDSVGTGQKNLSPAMIGAQECWMIGNLGSLGIVWHRASSSFDKLGKSHLSCAALHSQHINKPLREMGRQCQP